MTSWKLRLSILALALLEIARPKGRAGSDPTAPTASDASGVFGEAARYPQPDPVTGAMSYSVPFLLLQARGAAQPGLAVSYSSSAAEREAGYGWGIDLPSIERRALSGWPKYRDDGAPANEDRYVFNGQPLLFVCVVGDTGCEHPTAPMPTWAAGWRSYRLQIEGTFSRFFLSPTRTTWRVQRKGGEILELGLPLTEPAVSPAAAAEKGDGGRIFRWRVVRQFDVHGNYVVYQWRDLGLRGLLFPTDIYDTPPKAGPRTLDRFAHHTQLTWELPGFPITRYGHIDKAQPDMRLSRVAVASMPWSGAGPREIVRLYHLRYLAARTGSNYNIKTDAPLWHHSFLKEIQLEGACQAVEISGRVPATTQCEQMPPMTFEYQGAKLSPKGGVFSAQVRNGPPNAEANFEVLPHVESAAVIDLNHDGLPDIVQSWPEGAIIDMTNFPHLRKRPGYINVGDKKLLQLQLAHQCMDMGTGEFGGDLASMSLLKPAGFLTGRHGASVMGPWGDSPLLWSVAGYSPITAIRVEANSGFCDQAATDPEHPAWKWVRGDVLGWFKAAQGAPSPLSRNRWFADVDGDGIPDSFDRTEAAGIDLERATVDFTKRFSKAERSDGPALEPFTPNLNTQNANSLTPAESPRSDTKFFYVDVNGDGLVDLVTYNPADDGGIPRVRPGDGRGRFACEPGLDPAPCAPASPFVPSWLPVASLIDVPDPTKPWPFNDDTYFHDMTGDGLADIIKYEPGNGTTQSKIRLWINEDGHTFRCATPTNVNPCQVWQFFDDLHATALIEPHRMTFADMDANGTDDFVLLGKSGPFAYSVFDSLPFASPRAPRPGVLTKIHNGLGATSEIDYRTIQELDLEATGAKDPWEFHSPQVTSVVTRIRTRDTPSASGLPAAPPYAFDRSVAYSYRDPAYDPWTRGFLGFRKVRVKQGLDLSVTETTYWFGPCQRGLRQCPQSSDDDDSKAQTGRPVRVDRFVPEVLGRRPAKLLQTTLYSYSNESLFQTADRTVHYSYARRVDTYLYDDALPFTPGVLAPSMPNGDLLEDPARQAARVHLAQTFRNDENGNLIEQVDEGRPRDDGTSRPGVDGRITRTAEVHCNKAWQCLVDKATISSDPLLEPERRTRYTYDNAGDLKLVEAFLTGTESLDRFHETPGAPVAPAPPGASTSGWTKLREIDYDSFGNAIAVRGPGVPVTCTTVIYDRPFAQFPETSETRGNGCGAPGLRVTRSFHRGFESMDSETSPTAGLTKISFDAFGRPINALWPSPDAAPGTAIPALTFRYNDRSPLSWVVISRRTGGTDLESVEVFNGLGERVFGFDKADPSAGDLGNAVLRDWTERDSVGRSTRTFRPSFFTGDPIAIAGAATAVPPPTAAGAFDYTYDEFGRPVALRDAGVQTAKYRYRPLESDFFDAEQLKPSGPRSGMHTTLAMDGHGRAASTVAVVKGDAIRTEASYLPMGEVFQVVQSHAAGVATVSRTLTYDSLGRLVRNEEPNTSSAGHSWRYAWDDAGRLVGTSDARGCGENFLYDGLGRLEAEDYSPCLGSQPAYTAPNRTTGDGTEAFFRYDSYEAGQVKPVPGFADAAGLEVGRLVSVQDRGSHTRYNYDVRGRLRRQATRVAVPGAPPAPLAGRYAPHWYETRMDFDAADRPTGQTSGVDAPELLVAGVSSESYSYTTRGFLAQVSSTYGVLISKMRFDADGSLRETFYGDAASTKATLGYDSRRRLATYSIARAAPSLWATATPTYSPPGPETTQLQIANLTYAYDDMDNLVKVQDGSPPASWPMGIKPNDRQITYDDSNRVTRVDYTNGFDGQVSPYEAEEGRADRRPVPVRSARRMQQQKFGYDWKGNTTSSDDDRQLRYDRSLGPITNGESVGKPNQFQSAGSGVRARHDAAGNLVDVSLERANCPGVPPVPCTHRFVYDWNEVGQLARARRWDYPGATIPSTEPVFPKTPTGSPAWDVHYAYSMGYRLLKSVADSAGMERHSISLFGTLQIEHTAFRAGDYERKAETVSAFLGGVGRLFFDARLPSRAGDGKHVFLQMGDHLGSTMAAVDLATGELVERTGYQAFGAVESDYRPARWNAPRETYKFTRKAEDIEVGVSYFGARNYQSHLGRWMSADPLTVHGLAGDRNPYAYVAGRVLTSADPIGLDGEAKTVCDGSECVLQMPDDTINANPQKSDPAPASAPSTPAEPPTPPSAPSDPKPASSEGKADTVGDRLSRLEARYEGAIMAAENFRGNIPGTNKHMVTKNIQKESWNFVVTSLQFTTFGMSPFLLPAVMKMGDLKMSIKSDPGDVSWLMPLIASLFVPGGGGSGAARSGLGRLGGYEIGTIVQRAGSKVTIRILGITKVGPGTMDGLLGQMVKDAVALGAKEVEFVFVNPNSLMKASLARNAKLLEAIGLKVESVSDTAAVVVQVH